MKAARILFFGLLFSVGNAWAHQYPVYSKVLFRLSGGGAFGIRADHTCIRSGEITYQVPTSYKTPFAGMTLTTPAKPICYGIEQLPLSELTVNNGRQVVESKFCDMSRSELTKYCDDHAQRQDGEATFSDMFICKAPNRLAFASIDYTAQHVAYYAEDPKNLPLYAALPVKVEPYTIPNCTE